MIIVEHIEPWSREGFEAMLARVRSAFEADGYDSSTMKLLPSQDGPVNDPCEWNYRWQAERVT